jgi:hypothetical protein
MLNPAERIAPTDIIASMAMILNLIDFIEDVPPNAVSAPAPRCSGLDYGRTTIRWHLDFARSREETLKF